MRPSRSTLGNPVTGFRRSATTDAAGKFVFRNLPPNTYHLAVMAQGFATLGPTWTSAAPCRSSVPVALKLAGATAERSKSSATPTSGRTRSDGAHRRRSEPDRRSCRSNRLRCGLNQVVTLASPGVVADSNGFFHPVGDHAQTQFSIDNQPVTDQQSRIYFESDLARRRAVDGGDHGRRAGRVRRQEQPRRPHRHQVGARSAEADRRRPRRLRIVQEPDGRGQRRRGLAHGRQLPVGQRARRRIAILDPPEFEALHDHGSNTSFFDRMDAHTGRLRRST